MILWRISNYRTLDGVGGLYVSGRWHTKGRPVIYLSLNPSTTLLEALVHMELDAEDRPERFQLLKIEVPDAASREVLNITSLPSSWSEDLTVTQEIGDQWLSSQHSLLLQVPSVLVPETANVLANPLHPEANSLKIVGIYEHPFDTRFYR